MESLPNNEVSIPSVQEIDTKIITKQSSKALVVVLIVLVILLMGGLTYYILKDNGLNLISGLAKSETNENTDSDSTTTSDSTATNQSCDLTTTNSGWALFSLPEYKFSFEMPNYWPKITLGGEEVSYFWTYKPYKATDSNIIGLLPKYLYSTKIEFMPSYIPSSVVCGGFCVKQHEISVNIFANPDHKNLSEISTIYFANWTQLYGDEIVSIENLGNSSKWNRNVAKYSQNFVESSYDGYLLVTENFIYEISYHISSDPTESHTVGEKVLDSMMFESTSPADTDGNNVTVEATYYGSGSSISSENSAYVYFQGSGDYDSTAVVYLIPEDNISISDSSIGKLFTFTYDSSKVTDMGTAAGTSYLKINGTFSYKAK